MVESLSNLHKIYNTAGIKRTSGLTFRAFLDACLAVGALGVVVNDEETPRYVVGEFSYTIVGEVSPLEDQDAVCIHPLFATRLFDLSRIVALGRRGVKPIYPYGSDPEHRRPDV
jgi:hypothetical protein